MSGFALTGFFLPSLFSFVFALLSNILAYRYVVKKYKTSPSEKVENNNADITMLYMCKAAGIIHLAIVLCVILSLMGRTQVSPFAHTLPAILLFLFTPSPKDGVKTIQDNYTYSQRKQNKQ